MNSILTEHETGVFIITLNRPEKHNAFDDMLLKELQQAIEEGIQHSTARAIVIKANGKHFCAGADAAWMKKMANYTEEENLNDALTLANVMHQIYTASKPVIAVVHGSAYGGGAGIVAACDIAIAATSARFCFSEVKLGLIPAVISPYVVKAIGERASKWLFMSADPIDALRAQALGLIQHCVGDPEIEAYALSYAHRLCEHAPQAVCESKALVDHVCGKNIDRSLIQRTASWIAQKRVSKEAQVGLQAFLNKHAPKWE